MLATRSAPLAVETTASMKRAWSSAWSPGRPLLTSSNGNFDSSATPLNAFWPCTATLYPAASNGSRGKASSTHFVSCRQTMSGSHSASQATAASRRCLIELTFQVAMRTVLEGEARAAAAGRGGLRIVYLEGRTDQIVDEIDLGAGHVVERDRIDQHRGAAALDHDVIVGSAVLGVELVLETGTASARDAHAQHRADRFLAQNLADLVRRPLGHGDRDCHRHLQPQRTAIATISTR